MMARKKIVPPVTPRIVQAHPGQRLFRYVLLVCAFLLAVWFSYDYGRVQAPANGEAAIAQDRESEQRIAKLEQERDRLKQRVAELERSVKQTSQAFTAAQAPQQTAQQTAPSQSETQAQAPAATVSEPVDNTLELENLRIEQTESDNVFRVSFSVLRAGDSTGRVIGTIWIAVNGFSGKQPRRLSFKTLSPDRRPYVKMGFDRQQDVMEDVVLPEDFRPKNILVEAKPYGEKYTGTSMQTAWVTTE
jgi:cell division protein FtsB